MFAYEVVRNPERLQHIANEVSTAEWVCLDLETTGLSPHSSEIRLVSLNTGQGVYVIDLFETKTLEPVVSALKATQAVIVGQNIKFDQKFLLHKYGLEFRKVFDTYRASNLIYNGKYTGKGAHDLYALYARELQIGPEAPDLGASDWANASLTQEQYDYAAEDVIHLPKLRTALKEKLASNFLNTVALIEFRAILPESAMELAGFRLDADMWAALAKENRDKEQQLRRELLRSLPHPARQMALPGFDPDFNLNSPDQLLRSLKMAGLDLKDTSEMSLAMFAKEFPIVQKVLEWRGYAQSVKTFGDEFLNYINPLTGRIHTSYYPYTGAGRYSSGKPNLQQIPRDAKFRKCFRPRSGRKLVIWDYSQIELRVAAEIAGDETLIGVYVREEDAHSKTASLVKNTDISQVTKADRQLAKAVNFGLIYGMAAPKLVLYAQANYGVSMSLVEAEAFRTRYFEGYDGIRRWHREIFGDENKKRGMTRTLTGRLRYLTPMAHNEYANSPVQGCLQPHARVLTDHGYREIGQLYTSGTEGLKVWTGTAWASFGVVNRGPCRWANITLSDGTVLPCDTRHKLLRVTENGYEWAEYADLRVGDKVATSMAQALELCAPASLAAISKGPNSTLTVSMPSGAEKLFWYWIGRYYGDGWKDSERGVLTYVFGEHERQAAEACCKFWRSFGTNPRLVTKTHRPAIKESTRLTVEIWSVDLCRWLSELGFVDADAHTKRIADLVFAESLANRTAFVRGFLESDGHEPDPKRNNPSFHLCQQKLLQDLKLLLRTLGVESKQRGPYRYKDQTSWRLDVFSKMFDEARSTSNGIWPKISMLAPKFLVKEYLAVASSLPASAFPSASARTLHRRMVRGGSVSVYSLRRLLAALELEIESPIYAHRSIKSKTELTEVADTFTLSVDDPLHRFDSEGVISKNTGADGLKASLHIVYDKLKKYGSAAQMVHMVHDEIIVEADDDAELLEAVNKDLEEGMLAGMQPMLKRVPVVAEGGIATSWAEK